jgi:hypothetical protein
MIGVGGFVGFARSEKGERARADIERVMRAFRKKREARRSGCRLWDRSSIFDGSGWIVGERFGPRVRGAPRFLFQGFSPWLQL